MATEQTQQSGQTQAAQQETAAALARGPSGIGTGVAFDWALAAQILWMAPFIVAGVGPGDLGVTLPLGLRIGAGFASLVAAAICVALGEALRRGNRYVWMFQIGFNTLLFFSGFFGLGDAIAALTQHGHVSGLVRSAVLLIISPLIVILLTRPNTRAWIKVVTPQQAMARHGGRWIAFIALWAIIGGALIAFNGYY